MDPLATALEVLSAMSSPALLIAACGTLILSTSNRLMRVVDRVHNWSDQFEALVEADGPDALAREKRAMVFAQLGETTRRARLLQRGMTVFSAAPAIICPALATRSPSARY
jgi:hypothetical protein